MVNKATLVGRVGKDPIFHTTQSGKDVVKFNLATSESFKDDSQESGWREQTEWHSVVVWGKSAKPISEKVKKGDIVYAEGKIRYRSYENKEGKIIYITEIVGYAKKINIGKQATGQGGLPESKKAIDEIVNNSVDNHKENPSIPENEDDLPF